jgi:hypothetical protein
MSDYYILDKKNRAIPVGYLRWKWYLRKNRIVKEDKIGDYLISTRFTGVDVGPDEGYRWIFETRVFNKNDENINGRVAERDCSYSMALRSHKKLCEALRFNLNIKES